MNHDFAILRDGTRKLIDDFAPGTLLVACQRREVSRIVHVRSPRPFGAWVKRKPKPLTASQQRCIEGTP